MHQRALNILYVSNKKVLFVFGNINRPEKPTRGHLTKVPFGVG
jgi:hypothetical protein